MFNTVTALLQSAPSGESKLVSSSLDKVDQLSHGT
jgi:hypothetical protein